MPFSVDVPVLADNGKTLVWNNALGRFVLQAASLPRATASYTTASLANAASETGTITLAKTYRLLRITTDRAARVRLYTTAAKRTADAARAIGVDPTGDHGVVLDYVTTASVLAADLSPVPGGANLETSPSSSISLAITNQGTTGTVTVTFTFLADEA